MVSKKESKELFCDKFSVYTMFIVVVLSAQSRIITVPIRSAQWHAKYYDMIHRYCRKLLSKYIHSKLTHDDTQV